MQDYVSEIKVDEFEKKTFGFLAFTELITGIVYQGKAGVDSIAVGDIVVSDGIIRLNLEITLSTINEKTFVDFVAIRQST